MVGMFPWRTADAALVQQQAALRITVLLGPPCVGSTPLEPFTFNYFFPPPPPSSPPQDWGGALVRTAPGARPRPTTSSASPSRRTGARCGPLLILPMGCFPSAKYSLRMGPADRRSGLPFP